MGRLYRSLFRMNTHCDYCGLVYEREQGYFIGAIYINVIATESLLLGTLLIYGLVAGTVLGAGVASRVIPDIEATIVATINEVRKKFDYVFTTGGIGPTHDDITADSIAKAFGVGISEHPEAVARMTKHYGDPALFTPSPDLAARLADLVTLLHPAS